MAEMAGRFGIDGEHRHAVDPFAVGSLVRHAHPLLTSSLAQQSDRNDLRRRTPLPTMQDRSSGPAGGARAETDHQLFRHEIPPGLAARGEGFVLSSVFPSGLPASAIPGTTPSPAARPASPLCLKG